MKIMVQKYGGTSVAGLERMRKVLSRVRNGLDEGYKVIVVLSAMAGETNKLIGLANEFSAKPDPEEMDALVVNGENVSIALFSLLAKSEGIRAKSLQGWQIPITTTDAYMKARIISIDEARLRNLLEDHDVLVVAGFQGVDCKGRMTTLGRGGSDTTGVALAAAVKADVCEIYTDVDGVFTTDPRVCSAARKLDRICYDEMLELASSGSKVLQIRSVEFAKKFNVPVRVRSTFTDDPGTLVTQEDDAMMEDLVISGIAFDRDQCRVTVYKVKDKPGVAATIFGAIAAKRILVDMIIQNTSHDGYTDMTFTVSRGDLDQTLAILAGVGDEIGAESVQHDTNVAKVSVVGVGMRNHSGVASTMFQALCDENVNIKLIATSEIKITCLIDEKYVELAVRALHTAFGLDKELKAAC
ncbi:Aspartate kinase Ask_LysC [Fundidesulfovibrio magnetotacticus]|uniref:Aspartokinase n=1 Tax=Fundidesulfovibrio magnetotacticus TaxID=2730080 RepID=A0A6V8LYT5_9BACT|nr:aspartate kinase [Fundidesulfovibrio magnetotacticus]GFK95169.1 Aspartate kinase Ask_LysC [Fundidesulfovibrio magnetotacticus]